MTKPTNTQSSTAFDPTKPVQTRDGRKARILATDIAGDAPIAVAIEIRPGGPEIIGQRDASGFYAGRKDHPATLVNVPEVTTKIDNVYRDSRGRLWSDYASVNRHDWGPDNPYVGFIEWTLEDGEPVSCRFVKDNT